MFVMIMICVLSSLPALETIHHLGLHDGTDIILKGRYKNPFFNVAAYTKTCARRNIGAADILALLGISRWRKHAGQDGDEDRKNNNKIK